MITELKQQIDRELPPVRTTQGKIIKFNSDNIRDSLIRETGMPKDLAINITNEVVRRIFISGSKWLSGPQIREICCSILAERNEHLYRKLYTRVGIPFYDYYQLLQYGLKENSNQNFNPESIHYWKADKISEEFWLLYISNINNELSDSHLDGTLHIHNLRHFDRPFCQNWDLRMIFRCGLPPGGSSHFANSGPANHPIVAFLHAAKWFGIVQGLFQGGQGYDGFCEFLAPYVRGLSNDEIEQLAQCFIYESNQVYAARAQVPFTSIDTAPTISKSLQNIPAVSLGGKLIGVYGDYSDECEKLFIAISKVYEKGDTNGRVFNFPKHEVKIRKEWFEKYIKAYMQIMKEASIMGTPYFLNHPSWLPEQIHSQCCRMIMQIDDEGKNTTKKYCRPLELFDSEKWYQNMGSLQAVSINLPRISYLANKDDNKFFEILETTFKKAVDILFIKKDLVQKAINEARLDLLCNQVRSPCSDDKQSLYNINKCSVTIGFIGGNEMARVHTGYQLHEDNTSLLFLRKVLKKLVELCHHYSVLREYDITLWEQPAESTSGRFAKLDTEKFGRNNVFVLGNGDINSIYYTNSSHFNYAAHLPMIEIFKEQAENQKIVQGGVITHAWLGESHPDPKALWDLTKKIATNTETAYWTYTYDFTQCLDCNRFYKGIHDKCLICGSTNVDHISRITGYYGSLRRWNQSKIEEFKDRFRQNV